MKVPEKYLPLGSVVRLIGATKTLMIYGRLQLQSTSGHRWDYVACLYPEGNVGEEFNVFFDHDGIEEVYFLGYENQAEKAYNQQLLSLDA